MEDSLTHANVRARRLPHGGKLIVPLTLLLISANCLAAGAAGIKWYAGISLGDVRRPTVETWRESLSQPWRLGGDPVVFSMRSHGKPLTVDRCSALFVALDKGHKVWGADRAIFDGWAVRCIAVRAVVNAASPRQSHVASFRLDEKGARALPVELAFQISRDDERKMSLIKSAGGSLGNYLGSATMKMMEKSEEWRMIVRDANGVQWLSVLAEGDFDHDGIDDLLVSSSNSVTGGSYNDAHLYIVSRLNDGGPMVLRETLF